MGLRESGNRQGDAAVMLDDSLVHFWPSSLRPVSTRPPSDLTGPTVIDVTMALMRQAYTLREEADKWHGVEAHVYGTRCGRS